MQSPLYKSINSKPGSIISYLASVWNARHLVISFAKRDLKVQYAQTYLGVLWALIQPLTGLFIFTVFFQKLIHIEVEVPYAVFAFTGIMGWYYFTALVGHGGTSLMHNQHIVRKINFPKLVLPLSKVLVALVEFGISLIILIVLMAITGCTFSARILWLPLVIAANVLCGLSLAVWLSALTIRYRDLHHIISYLIGFGIWATPVFYPVTIVPERFNLIYYFHPVANVIAAYRYIFIGMPLNVEQLMVSLLLVLIVFITGIYYFIRNEKYIADYL